MNIKSDELYTSYDTVYASGIHIAHLTSSYNIFDFTVVAMTKETDLPKCVSFQTSYFFLYQHTFVNPEAK